MEETSSTSDNEDAKRRRENNEKKGEKEGKRKKEEKEEETFVFKKPFPVDSSNEDIPSGTVNQFSVEFERAIIAAEHELNMQKLQAKFHELFGQEPEEKED